MTQYRKEKAANPFCVNDRLHNSIKSALRQLYVLLGCAVRLRARVLVILSALAL